MTPDKTPSDSEIEELARPFIRKVGGHWENDDAIPDNGSIEDFARAILAKWGSPVVAGEPWGASVGDRVWVGKLPTHVPKLAEEEGLPIQWLYTTPQPTQAQAGAVDDAALIRQLVAAIDDMRLAAAYTTYGAPNWDDLEPALKAARARLKDAP